MRRISLLGRWLGVLAELLMPRPFVQGGRTVDFTAAWLTTTGISTRPNSWLRFREWAVPTYLSSPIAFGTMYGLCISGKPVAYEGGLNLRNAYRNQVALNPYLKTGRFGCSA